ncbi:MAG: MATE family efflux transporter [Tissierellia bacterium]|nr:MATE family efflux transporter [Tissierellia bacterium]
MNSVNFEKEKISTLLIKIAIPLMISMLVTELYNMVDTYFVSHYVGSLGIAYIMIVFPLQRFIAAMASMLGTGTSATLSRQIGLKDEENIRSVINQGVNLVLLFMVPIIILLFIFQDQILYAFGASADTLEGARIYLHYISIGSIFIVGTNFISRVLISFGESKLSLQATLIGALINVLLDYILVVHVKIGITGAGFATMFSQICGFIYALSHFRKLQKKLNMKFKFEFNKIFVKMILTIGLAAFLIELEDGIVIGVLNNLLRDSMGDKGVVILGLITKVYMFLFITSFGISSAMQPIAAYEIGAGRDYRLKDLIKKTIFYSFITTAIVWLICMIFSKEVLSIFLKDEELLTEAAEYFRIVISVFPILAVYYVSIFFFQAQGNARASVLASIMRQLLIMIPLSIVLVKVFNLGGYGVWIAYPITDILASIISVLLMRNNFKNLSK